MLGRIKVALVSMADRAGEAGMQIVHFAGLSVHACMHASRLDALVSLQMGQARIYLAVRLYLAARRSWRRGVAGGEAKISIGVS